jgi:triosephosphate isomerase (TIM)
MKPLIVANWKMNFTVPDALKFVTAFSHELKVAGDVEIVIAPPMTALYSTGVALSETPFKLAAQNMYWEESGAYTGEVSGLFLKDLGCEYVILGHSERRHIFGETDEMVGKKVHAALRYNLIPILCVGETLKEREAGETWDVCKRQLREGLASIPLKNTEKITIAYEPVWAIGTGKQASPEQAEEVHSMIKDWLAKTYDSSVAQKTQILYGGSVKSKISHDIMAQRNVDGFLVGGASLDPVEFANIIRNIPPNKK